MGYIIMVKTYDGLEFRGTDDEYASREEAFSHLDEVSENWPDGRYSIEELKDMDYYMRQQQAIYEEDEYEFDRTN